MNGLRLVWRILAFMILGVVLSAGFTPNEGEKMLGDYVYKAITTDRTANMELGLFTNVAPTETITHATLTQPTGTGYAVKVITDATWTVTNDLSTYPLQTFTGGAGGWTGSVQGYFLNTNGVAKRILHIEVDAAGPFTIAENDTYDITLSNTIA